MEDIVTAEIITIGDEILYGQIVDTNAQWMSATLDAAGIKVIHRNTIGDNEDDILDALATAEARADVVLVTGGLGPTSDDLTKPCLAKYFNVELRTNEGALHELEQIFDHIDKKLSATNKAQTELPVNSTYISNRVGTAPGMWFDERDTVFVSMPGVPFEMKSMMTEHVIPRLHERFNTPVVIHKIIRTIGIGESWLADKIKDWESNLPEDIKLAYLPGLGQVKLRLTSIGRKQKAMTDAIDEQVKQLKEIAGKYIYGYDDDTIEAVVGKQLIDLGYSLATAESCTGGYLAHMITSVPGSSAYYNGGIIAYDNSIKSSELQVTPDLLKKYGAVSEEVVTAMAEGVRNQLKSNIGIATSGIAGPEGGTKDKPVGTIWIGISTQKTTQACKLSLFKDRSLNIKTTAVATLALTFRCLKEE